MIGRVTRIGAVEGSSFPPHPAENSPCETQTSPNIFGCCLVSAAKLCCDLDLSLLLLPHFKQSETEPSLKLRAMVRNVW